MWKTGFQLWKTQSRTWYLLEEWQSLNMFNGIRSFTLCDRPVCAVVCSWRLCWLRWPRGWERRSQEGTRTLWPAPASVGPCRTAHWSGEKIVNIETLSILSLSRNVLQSFSVIIVRAKTVLVIADTNLSELYFARWQSIKNAVLCYLHVSVISGRLHLLLGQIHQCY